jgi:NADH-quinone oxidoreductase subunit E
MRQNPPQKLIEIFARHHPSRESLVQILEDTQQAFGYISRDAIGHISDFLTITRESLLETASFYPVFRLEPAARCRIALCRGETCSRRGAVEFLETIARELRIADGETTPDGMFSLELVPCRGICAEFPTVSVNDRVLDVKTPQELARALRELAADAGRA